MYLRKLTRAVVVRPDYPVVETKYGKIRGMLREGIFLFRGIEYAKAERFHLPEEPDSWEGIRSALQYGPACEEVRTQIPADAFLNPHFWYPQSEDCQNLNIWTPTLDREEKLPVMVWIHGGGQEFGSAYEMMAYDGDELAQWGNVVVVSVNHRLNVLGYLDLSAFGEAYRDSAYCGMMDLVQALRWIRENIAGFGGDPDNVMLFGQSGGGYKITQLMQMPAADGLFHKAAIHSGTGKDFYFTHENMRPIAEDILSFLGISPRNARELEEVPYDRLAEAAAAAGDRFRERTGEKLKWRPPTDNEVYFGNPQLEGIDFREETKRIPLLVGNVLGEFSTPALEDPPEGDIDTWSEETVREKLKGRYGTHAEEVVRHFLEAYPEKPVSHALYVDTAMREAHLALCRLRSGPGFAPVYNWMFALDMPCYGGSAPWHNADEAYVFHNAAYSEAQYRPGVSERVQDQMAGAWVAFAYAGDPNREGLPRWEPVSEDRILTMIFDEKTALRTDYDRELLCSLAEAEKKKSPHPASPRAESRFGGGPKVRSR